jgi:protein TonB
VAPPEQKVEMKPATEPAKPVPDAKPTPVKPKVVRPEAKKPNDSPPAPRTSAPPRVERQAQAASAASAGATASAIASYNQRVRAHLMRFHQYPSAANGQRGVARLSFTLSRSGQVSGSRLGGSSGVAALDAQAMAMIRQASPFPAIPPEVPQGSMSFSIPVEFTVR